MIVNFNNNLITIELSDKEKLIVDWIYKTYGNNEFRRYLMKWLENREAAMESVEKEEFFKEFKELTAEEKKDLRENIVLTRKRRLNVR